MTLPDEKRAMQASPRLSRLVLLLSVVLSGPAMAEYPFDPMMQSANVGPGGNVGPGFNSGYDDGYGLPDGYGYDDGYGPDPALYEFDDPYAGGNLFGSDTAIWPGFISGTIQPGTDRTIFGGEWFQPLYQDGQTMWYVDFRGQGDNNSASEFNLGTGVRTLTDPGWIFGAYGFWDHLNSSHGNNFNQGTIGFEAMDVIWDARFNVYFPESGAERVGSPKAKVSNGNVVVQSSFERAYWGMDFEVGNLLWAWGPAAQYEVRGFLGGYYFDHSAPSTPSIAGPRARLEWRWYDLPYFGPGSRFECGVSAQTDQVRDGQLFAFARMRIPLDPWAHDRKRLSPLHRRMLDHVVRDVDIVSAVSTRNEAAINTQTGRQIRGYQLIDGNTQFVGDVLDGVQEDALIVVDGRAGEITLPHSFDLKNGQTVLGGGSSLMVQGARTGQRATFEAAGTRPNVLFRGNAHIAWNGPTPSSELGWWAYIRPEPPGFVMNDHTQLIGVDVSATSGGVTVHHANDVLVKDVGVTDFSGTGIDVADSRNVTLDHVNLQGIVATAYTTESPSSAAVATAASDTASWPNPDAQLDGVGIFVRDSKDVQIQDSSIRYSMAEGIRVSDSKNVTIERTSIRDSQRDGIRLIGTEHVLLNDLDLKNVGVRSTFTYPGHDGINNGSRPIGGISLLNTKDTTILNSRIQGSHGIGVFGNMADSTRIDMLNVSDVQQGVLFSNSHDVTITNSTFHLTGGTASAAGTSDSHVFADEIAQTAGLMFNQVTGDLVAGHNRIDAGVGTSGIVFAANGAGTTQLKVTDNILSSSSAQALRIGSYSGHSLDALIADNQVTSDWIAFDLYAAGTGTNGAAVTHNQFDGTFNASAVSTTMDLRVTDNRLGGDPMGRVYNNDVSETNLLYRNNTSAPGADVIRFENEANGTFHAQISGNDHSPERVGDIDE